MEKENNEKPFVRGAECQNSEGSRDHTCEDDDSTKWSKHYNDYKHMYRHWEWDDDEHRQFLIGLEKYGQDWESICRHCMRTRTYNQVANHAHMYFDCEKKTLIPEEGVEKHKKRASIKDKTLSILSKKSAPISPKKTKKKNFAPSLPTSTTTIDTQDYTNNNFDHNHHASSNVNLLVPSSLSDNLDQNHHVSSNVDLLLPSSLSDYTNHKLVPSSSCDNIDDSIMPYDEPLYDLQFLQFEYEHVPAFFNSSVSDPSSFRMVEENQFNMASQNYTNNNLDHNQHDSSNINLLDVPPSLSDYTKNNLDHNHHASSNVNLLVPSSLSDYTYHNLDQNHHASSNINMSLPSSLSDYTNHKLVPSSSCNNIDDSIMPYDEPLYDLQFLQFESKHVPAFFNSSVSDI